MSVEVRPLLRGLLSTRRITQFTLVGIAGSIADMGTLGALHGSAGVGLVPAKLVAAEAGIVVAFALNEVWTFGGEGVAGTRALVGRFLTSNAIRVLGIGVAVVVLVALNTGFGVWYLVANAVGLGAGGAVNYVFEALWAWEIHR